MGGVRVCWGARFCALSLGFFVRCLSGFCALVFGVLFFCALSVGFFGVFVRCLSSFCVFVRCLSSFCAFFFRDFVRCLSSFCALSFEFLCVVFQSRHTLSCENHVVN